MKIEFRSSFARDLTTIREKALASSVRKVIEEIQRANSIFEIPKLKKLRGRGNYYRIRIRDHRVGVVIEGDVVTFVRFLNRKEIYRYFP